MTDRIEEPEASRDEVDETTEVVEEAPVERVQLEDMTVEPEAVVERSGDFVEAEAIERAVVEAVEEQTIEERLDDEELPAAEESERSAESEIESRQLDILDDRTSEGRLGGGEEGVPVIEVVEASEIHSDDDT